MRHFVSGAILFSALATFSLPSWSTPVTYELRFRVTQVTQWWNAGNPADKPDLFDYKPTLGEVFAGLCTLEDSTLAVDGMDRTGGLISLELELAGLRWSYDKVAGKSSTLQGFRSSQGMGAASPSFHVVGGELVGWEGGVYGPADPPFVDFFGTGFTAQDVGGASFTGEAQFVRAGLVPEPSSLAMLIPFVILFAARGTKARRGRAQG